LRRDVLELHKKYKDEEGMSGKVPRMDERGLLVFDGGEQND